MWFRGGGIVSISMVSADQVPNETMSHHHQLYKTWKPAGLENRLPSALEYIIWTGRQPIFQFPTLQVGVVIFIAERLLLLGPVLLRHHHIARRLGDGLPGRVLLALRGPVPPP